MIKTFPLEFVRVALEQTLYEQHLLDSNYFGGENQIALLSFYEQLKSQEEIDRFVEVYRDLTNQENRADLIGNGIILSPENPSITNLYSCTIIPMTFTCSIRTKLSNRDQMIQTINNLIKTLKGKKIDMAQLECVDDDDRVVYVPFKVGTIGQNDNRPYIKSGDYIGELDTSSTITTQINQKLTSLANVGVYVKESNPFYLYCTYNDKLRVALGYNPGFVAGTMSNTSITYDYESSPMTVTISTTIDDINVVDVPEQIRLNLQTTLADGNGNQQSFSLQATLDNGLSASISDNQLVLSATMELESSLTWDTSTIYVYDYSTSVYYYSYLGTFFLATDSSSHPYIVFPSDNTSFEKYKLSMSFDAVRCDEPRTLNSDEYCEISFGGSATLVNNSVMLGNDMLKVAISKNKIVSSTDITLSGTTYYLEPLEMPSGSNANTVISQLASNYFKQNTHTDGLSLNLQYSFILDTSIDLLKQWFDYARYGTYGITTSDISPNMIYNVIEFWSSWGVFEYKYVLAKIVESIEIENTESDTLTIGVNMQIQGENN